MRLGKASSGTLHRRIRTRPVSCNKGSPAWSAPSEDRPVCPSKPNSMKPHLLIPAAALLSLAPLASRANAQEKPGVPPAAPSAPSLIETTETTRKSILPDPSLTKMEGKIHLMDPETKQLLLRTKLGKAPIGLTCNAATQFIDLDGKPVDMALLKPEIPVEVNFAENGNELIAAKVVVQRIQVPLPGGGTTLTTRETLKPGGKMVEETIKTTVVMHSGTILKFEPGVLTLKADQQEKALRYQYSKTTTWTNAAGEPVSPSLIKAGLPVKVRYSQRGDTLFADEVVIVTAPGNAAAPTPSNRTLVPSPEK